MQAFANGCQSEIFRAYFFQRQEEHFCGIVHCLEMQIRTLAMDLWASLEHDIKYKSLYQDVTMDFSDELKECSRLIYEAEEKMEIMNATLEE